MEGVMIFLQ